MVGTFVMLLSPGAMTAPDRTVLWDGAAQNVGVGWVAGSSRKVSIRAESGGPGIVRKTIRLKAAEPNTFIEFGWQWAPWSPQFAGTDLTSYDSLELSIRLSGSNPPIDLLLSMASPGDHRTTPRVSLVAQDPHIIDSKWHRIRVPMRLLFTKESKCDRKHVIQMIIGTWNGPTGSFSVDIEEIAVAKS